MMLEQSTRDFQSLIERLHILKAYDDAAKDGDRFVCFIRILVWINVKLKKIYLFCCGFIIMICFQGNFLEVLILISEHMVIIVIICQRPQVILSCQATFDFRGNYFKHEDLTDPKFPFLCQCLQ